MDLLEQAYNRDAYLDFLAGKFDFSKYLVPIQIDNNEVERFEQLGTVKTDDDKALPVFEIHIKSDTQLSRNRVQLRNLVAKQIQIEDGALAVYVDETSKKWRFSFIAIEYSFTEDGLTKTQTASKRFTYLLGEKTQTRTARDRFGRLNKQSTLEDLTAAFAVEPLNKEFYDKLYKWYEKAQGQVIFPNDEQAENHIQTSLIRLLTRLLFIWFLKEKKLINPDLFDKDKLPTLIDYEKPSSFYKAILQNLFFATLNKQITKRGFRTTTKGVANGTNYLVLNIYRYQSYFTHSDKNDIMALFEQSPFLNGGLFECLDHEASDDEKQDYDNDHSIRPVGSAIRIDGFSDRHDNQLAFANSLFFNDDETGLIDLFNQYQFTVEESTPLDIEVALDPELLGKVFENLLASYNPETGQQARKATGSFYTPREIVSYMVDESLKAYLTQAVPPHDGDSEFYQERLTDLFATSDNTGELKKDNGTSLIYPEEIPKLIKAISQIKILDPAVGSGAYPMGLLQRATALLSILDPDNQRWKQEQLDIVASLTDTASKEQASKEIEAVFSQKNAHNNYGRKLYLIENCIYGVDIQPIAIQICKLRFFISLTIEQSPNQDKTDNYGIKALPNLETKFIVANSLLSLGEMPNTGQFGIFDVGIATLQQQLAAVRHKHFSARTLTTKRKYRAQDKTLRQEMLAELTKSGITPAVEISMIKIVNWDLYNQNSIADWFDPKWQFGVKDGFDIVIGNPPYITYGLDARYARVIKSASIRIKGVRNTRNLFAYFIEKAITLLNNKGTLTFIVPHSISRVDGYQYIRKFINDNSVLWQIVDEYNRFNNVTLEMVTIFCSKEITKPQYIKSLSNRENRIYQMPSNIYDVSGYYPIYYDEIYKKINKNGIDKINGYRGFSNLSECQNSGVLCIGGKNIKAYEIELGYKEYNVTKARFDLKNKEIVITQFGASPRGMIIDTDKIIPSGGCVVITHIDDLLPEFVLALINSQTVKYFFDRYIVNNAGLTIHLDGHYLRKIPIPEISKKEQQPFIDCVDKIIKAKQQGKDTRALETQIDRMVYKLYNLTTDEIKIIENIK